MAHRVWVTGDQVTLARIQDLEDEGVTRCTSTTRPPATTGMTAYETDTGKLIVYNGSAWAEVARTSAAAAWTPTITQSGTVAHTATYAKYNRSGRWISADALLAVTGAGTGANNITVTLPATAAQAGNMVIGSGLVYDASAGYNYPVICVASSTTTVAFVPASENNVGGFLGTAVMSAGLAAGDTVNFQINYEAAS